MAFGVTWYLHVPVPGWIGSRNVEAVTVKMSDPVLVPAAPVRSAEAVYAEAEEAFGSGRWVEAADGYRRVTEIEPGFGSAYTRWTRALINQNRVAEAAERGRQAVTMNPQSAEARAVYAVALDWGGQIDRAGQVALEGVMLDKSSPSAMIALAEVYADQYRLRESEELLIAALDRAPADPEVYRTQGVIRETRADYAGAVEAYARAIELAPNWSYLYISLGHAYRAQQLYDDALAAFGRASELFPSDARAEGGRGMVFRAREEHEHAIERFQRAIELDPTYATAYAQLAWIHYARREYDRAETLFARAVELDREPSRVAQYRHALGWIYLSSKRPAEAREQFTKALELNPSLKGARDGLAVLQSPAPAAPRR
jgi:tetratricopeptide (TPR) repeat protein